MQDRTRQANAYLDQAERTLETARILFDRDAERYAAQIVKNGYDSLEQALSAVIAAADEDIPRRHPGKVQRFFELYDEPELERLAFHWLSRRSEAQYVDFEGGELSIPAEKFDEDDAERIVDDAGTTVEVVRERIG